MRIHFSTKKHDIPINGSQKRKVALQYQLDAGTPCHKLQHISTESHTDVQKHAKKHTKQEIGDSCEQKWTEKHETFVKCVQFWTRKHDIPMDGIQKTL